jgi:hypothetical protein
MAVGAVGLTPRAQAAEDIGPIVESFACTLNAGKDMDDLWSAVDFWNKQMDKIDEDVLDGYFAAIVWPLRANIPADFYWIGSTPTLTAMGQGLSAYLNSPAGQAGDARINEVASCKGNTFVQQTLHDGFPEEDATPDFDVVELYGCTMRHGGSAAASKAADDDLTAKAAAEGTAVAIYRWQPFFANTPFDLVYLSAYEDLPSWAAVNRTWLTSAEGQANAALYAQAMDCETGIFAGRVIRRPAAE